MANFEIDKTGGPDSNGRYWAKVNGKTLTFGPTTNSAYQKWWFIMFDDGTVLVVEIKNYRDMTDAIKTRGPDKDRWPYVKKTHGLWNVAD